MEWIIHHQMLEEKKNLEHVEEYGPHLKIFKKYWAFDYENISNVFNKVRLKYKGTLIEKFLDHNSRKGPININ